MFATTFLLASGYAAFSTVLNINAKGNLIEKENITVGGKKIYIATSGDGLYHDETEENRYIFKGTNPDNYITFNNELWRIIAIEPDGAIKIIIESNRLGTKV